MVTIFDVEATGAQRNHAHPYDYRNVACNIGFMNHETKEKTIIKLEYDDEPYGENLKRIQSILDESTLLVGANLKFDIAWLHRYGLVLPDKIRIFDIQLVYFILTHQKNPYPSVDDMTEFYGLPSKLDVVKTEYWDRGLDTNEVPYPVLCEYLEQDLEVTSLIYDCLVQDLENQTYKMQRLISMSLQDELVLQDLERNGLLLDVDKSIKKGNEIVAQIGVIDNWLRKIFNAPWFNPNSGDHLSVLLYGGTLQLDGKEEYIFTYKDGRTAPKVRNIKIPFVSKGLFKPLPRTELAKEGFYATNEGVLIKLAQSAKGEYKTIINTILERAKLEKRRGTYYHGYPKKLEQYGWRDNVIHSNFNQCVAASGRLSSTKPNVQNIEEKVNEVFITRF